MTTNNQVDLEAIEVFAKAVDRHTLGVWFNPYTMAQTMLGLIDFVREADHERKRRLRQYDAITLEVSIILEKADGLSKKQIVARLRDLYNNGDGPA